MCPKLPWSQAPMYQHSQQTDDIATGSKRARLPYDLVEQAPTWVGKPISFSRPQVAVAASASHLSFSPYTRQLTYIFKYCVSSQCLYIPSSSLLLLLELKTKVIPARLNFPTVVPGLLPRQLERKVHCAIATWVEPSRVRHRSSWILLHDFPQPSEPRVRLIALRLTSSI
jgi:hypothetical protein